MKKTVLSCMLLMLACVAVDAQSTKQTKVGSRSQASTFAQRFDKFVQGVAAKDSLSAADKAKRDSTYQSFLEEYRLVKDSLSDEDVRRVSKAKVKYQKAKVSAFADKTSDQVADTANGIGEKVSRVFKKTKKKVEGAIDALKE